MSLSMVVSMMIPQMFYRIEEKSKWEDASTLNKLIIIKTWSKCFYSYWPKVELAPSDETRKAYRVGPKSVSFLDLFRGQTLR